MKNTNSNKIVTVVIYNDVGGQMKSIIKDNKGKSGIYRWVNKENGKTKVFLVLPSCKSWKKKFWLFNIIFYL